jgi:hypothetical protein
MARSHGPAAETMKAENEAALLGRLGRGELITDDLFGGGTTSASNAINGETTGTRSLSRPVATAT